MVKILPILGILLAFANDASSSDEPAPIPPKSDNSISSPRKKDELTQRSDMTYWDKEVISTESGFKISPGYIPDWFWANGTPLSPQESETLERKFNPLPPDNSPEWYWGDGEPLSLPDHEKMAKPLTFPGLTQKDIRRVSLGKKAKPAKIPKKNEVHIIADHIRQNVKKEIIWAWGKVKIRMEDKIIQADKIKINNKTGEGKAKGNIIIKNKDGTRLKAANSRFNIQSHKGKLFHTRGRIGKKHFIKSRELSRISEKQSKGKSVSLTTCTGKLPDWLFEAEHMDIIAGDRAVFTDGVLKIRGIPVLYVPAGYLPIDRERKSGFLFPSFGTSDIEGATLNNEYFWAINKHSDATFKLGYKGKRGFSPGIEYRYTPSLSTEGFFSGTVIDDKITGKTFWKADARHSQKLPMGFQFNGTLDLEGGEFNKTFNDNTSQRNRRISNSYATIRKSWDSSSLEILSRYRDSTDIASDQTLGELPQITYKTQKQAIGDSKFYFNQDTRFTSFLTDLNSDPRVDNNFSVQRLDFRPQVTRTIALAPWLSLTPTLGFRETLYSKGKNGEGFFSRESLDLATTLKGPTFEKVFETHNKLIPKVKHLLEPRLIFSYTPEFIPGFEEAKGKIRPFDGIDSVGPTSVLTYSLIQRILQKESDGKGDFNIREALRFTLSQSYNLREASRAATPGNPREPFSDVRLDLDSRLVDPLLFNMDASYDINDKVLKTFNLQVGFRPMEALTLYLERRFTRRKDVSSVATLDWNFLKGWNLKASTRLDEKTATHRESNFSLLYDNPCKCWGFNFDFIQRNNFNSTSNTSAGSKEKRFLMGITFRGLGSISSGTREKFIHKSFESIR